MGQLCQGLCSATRSKERLEFPAERKRAGLMVTCAVMDGGNRISRKGKNWTCHGKVRIGPVSKMGPGTSHIQKFMDLRFRVAPPM